MFDTLVRLNKLYYTKTIADLNDKIVKLTDCISTLDNRIKKQEEDILDLNSNCHVAINWNSINPLTIKRLVVQEYNGSLTEHTLVTFTFPGYTDIKNWKFDCSRDIHEELVKEFIKHTIK